MFKGLKHQLLEPLTHISLIYKANKAEFDERMSGLAKDLNINVLTESELNIPIGGTILLRDEATKRLIQEECDQLISEAVKSKRIDHLQLTPTIKQALLANEARFGLIVIQSGFSRSGGNYTTEVLKSLFFGIVSLGMVQYIPNKAGSTLYTMIVDAENENIVFYRMSQVPGEPLNKKSLSKQYQSIFKSYFY